MPSMSNLITSAISRTKYMLASSPFFCSRGPLAIAPIITIRMTTFSNPFVWNPLLSSNPQAQMFGGNVPNMHTLVGGITGPPMLIGHTESSLINLPPPSGHYSSINHVPMTSYMSSRIPQPSLAPSTLAPLCQPQLSQGGTFYLGGN